MSLLYLVRHGQASAGSHDYDRLSDLGRQQSEMLGQWWKTHAFEPDVIYHGTLVRQRDTALSVLNGMQRSTDHINCQVHDGLNEYSHRTIESHFAHVPAVETPESMTYEDYLGIMQRWRDHDPIDRTPDSGQFESWLEFKNRGWQTIKMLHAQGNSQRKSVFVTSGGVIASIVSIVLDLDFEHTIDAIWRIRNSSITTLHYDGTQARLVEFNTIPHLQTRPDRSLITLI
jgi:broad specificity phosphatase PhoE